MRWNKKHKKGKYIPNDYEERTISKFLLIPKCINKEYRWLEKVSIKQHYRKLEICDCKGFFGEDSFYTIGGHWYDDDWG